MHYVNKVPADGVKFEGELHGFNASYAFHRGVMARFETRADWGDLSYTSPSTGAASDIYFYTTEGRLLAGYDFLNDEEKNGSVYSGLGYRFLKNKGRDVLTDAGFSMYDRDSYFLYLPFGFEGSLMNLDHWGVGFNVEYDVLLDAHQKNRFSVVDPLFGDVDLNQKHGSGWRTSLKIRIKGKFADVTIEPYFRQWTIGDSDVGIISYDGAFYATNRAPKNSIRESGVDVSLRY